MTDGNKASKGRTRGFWGGPRPETLADLVLVIAAIIALVLGVLDTLKLYELEAFKEHLPTITVFLLSFLILSVTLERRFMSARFHRELLSAIQEVGPDRLTAVVRYAGIRNVYTSRSDYAKFRGAAELEVYLGTAARSIDIVAYWLAHGIELEGVAKALGGMVARRNALVITIAILSPDSPSIGGLASFLGMSIEDLRNRVVGSLQELQGVKRSLSKRAAQRFLIKVYDTLPIASVIMLDVNEPGGRIQVDMKLTRCLDNTALGLKWRGRNHTCTRGYTKRPRD